MSEINQVLNWSRYNARLRTLNKTLGLPSLQDSKMVESKQNWARYYDQLHVLNLKLGLPSHDNLKQLTSHNPDSMLRADHSCTAILVGKQYMAGRMLQKEVHKYYGSSGVDSMMKSYTEVPLPTEIPTPPRQEMIDRVLIRRSLVQLETQKYNEGVNRKLNEGKEHLKTALKTLEIQNNLLGTEKNYVLPRETPPAVQRPANRRRGNQLTDLLATDITIPDLEKIQDDLFLDEVVEEVMKSYAELAPKHQDPAITEQQHVKMMSDMHIDRSVLLNAEEIILEMTLEMTTHIAADVVNRVGLSSAFDAQFNSPQVQEYLKNSSPLDF